MAYIIVNYIFRILGILLSALELVILIRCILSFIPDINNGFTKFIYNLSEPLLGLCRRILFQFDFFRRFPIDFSPILAFLLIGIVGTVLGMVQSLIWQILGLFYVR